MLQNVPNCVLDITDPVFLQNVFDCDALVA